MEKLMKKSPVALSKCSSYDKEKLTLLLESQFRDAGITKELICEKNVVIKPNLVMNKEPEFAATTHPSVIAAAARVLKKMGAAKITIAESSGGPYTEATIKAHYKGCGITEMAIDEGIDLNTKNGATVMHYPDGVKCKTFNIIDPIAEADVIVNICKLKTHSLTKMSAGTKNLFGCIPGVEKFEMHATFPDYADFGGMICDICEMLCSRKKIIAITDAIVGMEGDGPTAGTPRTIGALYMSENPFASDIVGETLLGFEGTVPIVREAVARGLCPADISGVTVLGNDVSALRITDFKEPGTAENRSVSALSFFSGGKLGRFFMPRPKADPSLCKGCGECVASCPQHTIELVSRRGKKIAKVRHADCIRCYCCQELCPFAAIKIKKNVIIKIINKL
jgi:uncharacterized protein (DUF362 family)/NAD-dependent dihydropyrimidine dehydrogenase PreA subunit